MDTPAGLWLLCQMLIDELEADGEQPVTNQSLAAALRRVLEKLPKSETPDLSHSRTRVRNQP